MKNQKKQLVDARVRIDRVDRELIRLLKERMNAVQAVGACKSGDAEAPLFDPDREVAVAHAWEEAAAEEGLSGYFCGRILREVLNYSRRSQEPLVQAKHDRDTCSVGYQGVPTCYSDLAIGKLFAHDVGHASQLRFEPGFQLVKRSRSLPVWCAAAGRRTVTSTPTS